MRYQVPQFIDIEDKIIGPLSFAQFVYIGGGVALAYVCYEYLPILLALPLGLISVLFGFALAFWKINNKPFIDILQAVFQFFFNARLYVWQRRKARKKEVPQKKQSVGEGTSGEMSEARLKDLAWSLDIYDREGSEDEK